MVNRIIIVAISGGKKVRFLLKKQGKFLSRVNNGKCEKKNSSAHEMNAKH